MPRGIHATRVIPKLVAKPVTPKQNFPPKLFNAKRRIKGAQGLLPEQLAAFKKNPVSLEWRDHVSDDVREFVDEVEANGTKLLPEEKAQLFQSPPRYFSRPHNVPTYARKQVYFPDFTVTLRRCNLGPYYAQFVVPIWFSKLDLKGYLKDIYDVDVVHIRSYVEPRKIVREETKNPFGKGSVHREPPAKRMTVQLVEPFTWPTKPSEVDKEPFQVDAWWKMAQNQLDAANKKQDEIMFKQHVDKKHRKSIARQADEMLQGRERWEPTWKTFPADVKAMKASASSVPDVRSKKQITKAA